MNSYNHYAYGAVGDWIYRFAAGIDATPLDAGFHTIFLHPAFNEKLGSIAFDYQSAFGSIHSDWAISKGTAVWHVSLPPNTTGWLDVDAVAASGYKPASADLANDPHVKKSVRDGRSGYELDSGSYTVSFDEN